ncbi:MAG: Holliday junction resolvase RuvX [Pseudomonadota bacterium]
MSSSSATRLLAIDFGLRQIGIAVGNALLGTTQPLCVLSARDGQPDWTQLQALLKEWQPDLVVVGDPLHMDGSVSELAQRARRFARRVHGRFGVEVVMMDERLTSFDVKTRERDLGHDGDYQRHPVDSLAAELILRDWLNQRGDVSG